MKRKRIIEGFESAAQTIGPISREMSLFAITRGQFSMIDAIFHCLKEIGTADISVWTWTIADYEVEAMAGLMARQEITSGRLVIDASATEETPPSSSNGASASVPRLCGSARTMRKSPVSGMPTSGCCSAVL